MRQASITDAAMLSALAEFFDSTCTIKSRGAETTDSIGQPTTALSTLAGHDDIPCRVAPVSALRGGRESLPEMVISTTAVLVVLQGSYPSITTAMQVTVGSTTHQIVNVIGDSESFLTELVCEVVS